MVEESSIKSSKVLKKRGRKPKPKPLVSENVPKVLKKRGRKPKPKPLVPENVPKKKRGRKKKCEMNLDTCKKITGFMENEDSIDTKDNQIQFMEQPSEESSLPCESISFGILNIKKHNVQKHEPLDLQKILHQKSNNKNSCYIDLTNIVDYISDTENNENNENRDEKKNLYDFFDNLQKKDEIEEKIEISNSPKYYSHSKKFPKNKDNIQILHCYKGKETLWKEKTNIWCWWCCHPFDGPPRFIPTKYDELRDRYQVTGNFCSWNCAKAFILRDKGFSNNLNTHYFHSLVKKIHGSNYNIKPSPCRQTLKCFGGSLTIEEFRNIDDNVYYDIQTSKMELDDAFIIKKRNRYS